jgi:hypothetical protein
MGESEGCAEAEEDGVVRSTELLTRRLSYCHSHSECLGKRCERQEKQRENRHWIGKFVDYVRREDSGMLRAMEAILTTGKSSARRCVLAPVSARSKVRPFPFRARTFFPLVSCWRVLVEFRTRLFRCRALTRF